MVFARLIFGGLSVTGWLLYIVTGVLVYMQYTSYMNRAEYMNLLLSHYSILERGDALSREPENGG